MRLERDETACLLGRLAWWLLSRALLWGLALGLVILGGAAVRRRRRQ